MRASSANECVLAHAIGARPDSNTTRFVVMDDRCDAVDSVARHGLGAGSSGAIIAEWLTAAGLEGYVSLFAEHEITFDVLPHLTESDIDQLGLPTGSRRRFRWPSRPCPALARATAPSGGR